MVESRKTVIILTVLALVLAVVLMALSHIPHRTYTIEQDEVNLFSYKTELVKNVVLTKKGDRIELIQDSEGWLANNVRIDYSRADLIVALLAYLYSDNYVGAGDFSTYGLETPTSRALMTVNGRVHLIDFGFTAANGISVYMRVDEGSDVYTVPKEVYEIVFSLFKEEKI